MSSPALRDIALEKGTDKQGRHFYADAYERHLGHLRDEPITLLEIGIGGYSAPDKGGASLRMWKDYFPSAQIIGLDIHDKSALAEDRITIVRGDQGDPVFLEQLARDHGPFDVVVDDGSHRCAHVITSFRALFPYLKDSGIYAIEDLQTSYWATFGGSSGRDRRYTSMTFIASLVDGLNFAEFDVPGYEPTYTDRWVQAVTVYHNLAFLQKGENLDPSNIMAPHPHDRVRFVKPRPPSPPRRLFRAVIPLRVRRVARDVSIPGPRNRQ